MTQPFSGAPDPGFSRWTRRRLQPRQVREALERAKREAQRYCRTLWSRGKRHPRTFALIGGAVALTLVGAYTLSASGVGHSLCPAPGEASPARSKLQKTPRFILLMDPVAHPTAGGELEIYYDICGLPSGTAYRGRVRLLQQSSKAKKVTAKAKPVVFTFNGEVDGPATRRRHELELGATRPGPYTLEFSVADNQGRERKKVQKIVVKSP